jgi:integrase
VVPDGTSIPPPSNSSPPGGTGSRLNNGPSASCRRPGVRVIRLHDLRHTHASLLIAAGVPVKVVSERLGHASPTFTIETYQHVLPGMQADAAKLFEHLIAAGVLPAARHPVEGRKKPRKKTA